MKILYDNTLSTKRLPKSHTSLLNSYESPTKLNIKLKTHSLTSLDIPLETFVGFKEISSSLRYKHQRTMAGSVDLISEIQQQPRNENFPSSKPLINMVSSNKSLPIVQQEWRQILKDRFRISRSFITPTSFNNSIARLRRSGHLRNIHQSSLQTIDKLSDRKHRFSLTHKKSIPKFTFRDLPSNSDSLSSSINQSKKSSRSQMSPFTSLPEIRSFVAQNCSDNLKTINDKTRLPPLSALPSWQKTGSWSWKSNDAIYLNSIKNERIRANIIQKEIQHQIEDQFRSNLPVIIESPLQQRSSLQIINHNHQYCPMRLTNLYHSNLSIRNDKIQENIPRFNQKKSLLSHSISNYDVSPHQFSSRPTTRYPSTPLLAHSRHTNNDKLTYHPSRLHISPLATFDDDDDGSDSISSNSSFRSCINSINEFSETNSSELSENSFQEMSSTYDINAKIHNETIKHSRVSIRHVCSLQ